MPLADAVGWLQQAGYPVLRFFPTDRHPSWIQVPGLGSIAVTDDKVPVKYLPLPEPTVPPAPPWTPAQILALFEIIPPEPQVSPTSKP